MVAGQVGEELYKQLQHTDALKSALAGTGRLVFGWDQLDETRRQKCDAGQLGDTALLDGG
jgi:hypothetical protein